MTPTDKSDATWNGKWCTYCRADTHNDAECWCTRPADWHPGRFESCDGGWLKIPTGPAEFKPAIQQPVRSGDSGSFSAALKNHLWRMYQEGQGSADHTAREVFYQMLDSLAQWLGQQPANAPSHAGREAGFLDLIRDILAASVVDGDDIFPPALMNRMTDALKLAQPSAAREVDKEAASKLADDIETNGLCNDPLYPKETRQLIVAALRAYVAPSARLTPVCSSDLYFAREDVEAAQSSSRRYVEEATKAARTLVVQNGIDPDDDLPEFLRLAQLVANAFLASREGDRIEDHAILLELCHQLGAKDWDNMPELLFDAVADALKYRQRGPRMVMVCGVDCHPGDAVCNNYCNEAPQKGPMADRPPPGPDAAPSSTACKPRGTYEPLSEAQIEELRRQAKAALDPDHLPGRYDKRVDALCDMAINSLLYGQEIHRLRDTTSASRRDVLEEAAKVCEQMRPVNTDTTLRQVQRDTLDNAARLIRSLRHTPPEEKRG